MDLPVDGISSIDIGRIEDEFESMDTTQVLEWCWEHFGELAAMGTSFQGSGLVAIDLALKAGCRLPVFTIDTGFLFSETLELKERLQDYFNIEIRSLEPALSPENQAEIYGNELWKRNPDQCCALRKVDPLKEELAQLCVWITGIRRDQSDHRKGAGMIELYDFDAEARDYILKVNPMANWSRDEVWDHIRKEGIPYNPLLDQGYRSIGCTHCTHQVVEGVDERAGRWLGFKKTECGLHTFLTPKGQRPRKSSDGH